MISTALRSILSGPAFGFQPVSMDDTPDTLGIPDGVDGLVHEATGVLRAVSSTVGAGGIRHQYLITYRQAQVPTGWRYVVLSCNCPCCRRKGVPACCHALLADTVLNHYLVKSFMLIGQYAGQTGPCEIVRAWRADGKCSGCGGATLYVHLYRPIQWAGCRANDRKTVCTGCGLWRHES